MKSERFTRPKHAPFRLGVELAGTYSWDDRTGTWLTLNFGRRGIRWWRAAR